MFDKNMKTVQSHIQIYTEKQNLYQNKNKNIIILALFNFFLFRNTNKNRNNPSWKASETKSLCAFDVFFYLLNYFVKINLDQSKI